MWSLHCSLNLIISVWNTYSGFSVFPGPWIIRHLTENDMVCLFLTVLERLQNKNDKLRPTFFQCKALSELRSLFKTKQKNKQTKKSLNISPIVAIGSMYYNIKPNFDTSSGERITKKDVELFRYYGIDSVSVTKTDSKWVGFSYFKTDFTCEKSFLNIVVFDQKRIVRVNINNRCLVAFGWFYYHDIFAYNKRAWFIFCIAVVTIKKKFLY